MPSRWVRSGCMAALWVGLLTVGWVGHVHAQAIAAPHADAPSLAPSLWRLPEPRVLLLGGSALVVSVAALVTGLRARDVQEVLDASCSSDRACAYPGFEDDRQRGQRLWNASRGLAISAGALAAAALSWWIVDRREELATRFGLGVSASCVEARLERRF